MNLGSILIIWEITSIIIRIESHQRHCILITLQITIIISRIQSDQPPRKSWLGQGPTSQVTWTDVVPLVGGCVHVRRDFWLMHAALLPRHSKSNLFALHLSPLWVATDTLRNTPRGHTLKGLDWSSMNCPHLDTEILQPVVQAVVHHSDDSTPNV